jgi:hypothetical protein
MKGLHLLSYFSLLIGAVIFHPPSSGDLYGGMGTE